jgi:hypothetical protein
LRYENFTCNVWLSAVCGILRGQMSKPIPVFGFAFSAFAYTHPGFGAGGRSQSERGSYLEFNENPEADRFVAAWRTSLYDRQNFTVCVRASKAATAHGFRLLTCAEPQLKKFEYLWLHEIEEETQGFAGIAREPRNGLASFIPKNRISFRLPNIAHWAHGPTAFGGAAESAEANV